MLEIRFQRDSDHAGTGILEPGQYRPGWCSFVKCVRGGDLLVSVGSPFLARSLAGGQPDS